MYSILLQRFPCFLAIFFGLLSTQVYSESTFKPEAMWPKLTQSGRYFNYPVGITQDARGLFYITNTGTGKVKVLTAEGELLRSWGGIGDQPGQFDSPLGIVLTGSGEVFVADLYNNRIQVFNSTGKFLRQWGESGQANGQLIEPTYLAIDSQGHIVVSDSGNHRVQIFDVTGKWLQTLGEGVLSEPRGIAFSLTGELYVADGSTHQINIFSHEGKYLRSFGEKGSELGQFDTPRDLAFDAQGLLYVTEKLNHRVQVFDTQGNFIRSWGGMSAPSGLTIDNKNNSISVADTLNHRISHFNLQGDSKGAWQSQSSQLGHFSKPRVSISPQGNIYVADLQNHRIQVFSSTGRWLYSLGELGSEPGQFIHPSSIAFDSQNNVYIAERGNARIQVFDQQGRYLSHFGNSGHDEHQLKYPNQIFIRGNLIYVTDSDTNKVQVYALDGTWQRSWGGKGSEHGLFDDPFGIVVDDNEHVYVADSFNDRIQVFDNHGNFLYQSGSKGRKNGEFKTPRGLALSPQGLLYVADLFNDRVQVFLQDGSFVESIGSSGTQGGQFGNPVTVSLLDEDTLVVGELANNRVQVLSRKNKASSNSFKAIILAGGGVSTESYSNPLWDSTQLLSNNAYFALRAQGYSKDAIKYLSSGNLSNDLDENGTADDLEAASLATLEQSIIGWAADANDVLIYLIDHGGPGTFKINQNEVLSREQLKKWVDSLQSQTKGKITVVIEACQSASFFEGLGGKNRVLIASADKQQPAVISNQGMNAFSYHFWYSVHTGKPLKEAFKKARQGMSSQTVLVNNKEQQQTAQLDANGDGLFNEADYTVLGGYCLGQCLQLAADEPQIKPITTSATLNGETSFALNMQVTSLAPISSAWATISRPDVNHTNLNQPITDLTKIPLDCIKQTTGNYQCKKEYPDFDVTGDYNITFHARDTQARTNVPNAVITIKQAAGKANAFSTSNYSTLYNVETSTITLQDVVLSDGQHVHVILQKQGDFFVLTAATLSTQLFEVPAGFSSDSGSLTVPQVEVSGHTYLANLQLQDTEGFVFKIMSVIDLGAAR